MILGAGSAGLIGLAALIGFVFGMGLMYFLCRRAREGLLVSKARMEAESEISGRLKQDFSSIASSALIEKMDELDRTLEGLENSRVSSYASMSEQIGLVKDGHRLLAEETSKLSSALSNPRARGKWGELQLRNAVELSGMAEHADFKEQEKLENGGVPDMVVILPGGRRVPVDAKTPMDAYLKMEETSDEAGRRDLLKKHSKAIMEHAKELGKKGYHEQCGSPFSIMFIPVESCLSAALQYEPSLLEKTLKMNVILATPTTLISMLKTAALGHRQERMSRNAEEALSLAKDTLDRVMVFKSHLDNAGKAISQAKERMDQAERSFEKRIMPLQRRFSSISGEI